MGYNGLQPFPQPGSSFGWLSAFWRVKRGLKRNDAYFNVAVPQRSGSLPLLTSERDANQGELAFHLS